MATMKERQQECCEVECICLDCNCEFWATLSYGRPVDENAKHHLCPDCYERAKREGTLEPAIPRYYPTRPEAGTGRKSIAKILSEQFNIK